MAKGYRANKGTKEFTDIQRIRHENDKLKRENARLRQQLARVDGHILDMVDISKRNAIRAEEKAEKKRAIASSEKEWECHECKEGVLQIHFLPRHDGIHYYRLCSKAPICLNRTKLKKYTSDVKGIKAKKDDEEES